MKSLTITLTLILSTLSSFAQDKKIVLQIDTLELNDCTDFSITILGQGFANLFDFIEDSVYIKNITKYPNFLCPITLKSDTSNIQISFIDNKGGYLLLTNAYQFKYDTIKIDKFTCLNYNYQDTVFTRIDYFLEKEDRSLEDKPLKIKHLRTIEKKLNRLKTPLHLPYKINNTMYLVTVQQQPIIEIRLFHGYKPRKHRKNRKNYKGKVIYFHGQSTCKSYINIATVKIKNNS